MKAASGQTGGGRVGRKGVTLDGEKRPLLIVAAAGDPPRCTRFPSAVRPTPRRIPIDQFAEVFYSLNGRGMFRLNWDKHPKCCQFRGGRQLAPPVDFHRAQNHCFLSKSVCAPSQKNEISAFSLGYAGLRRGA